MKKLILALCVVWLAVMTGCTSSEEEIISECYTWKNSQSNPAIKECLFTSIPKDKVKLTLKKPNQYEATINAAYMGRVFELKVIADYDAKSKTYSLNVTPASVKDLDEFWIENHPNE